MANQIAPTVYLTRVLVTMMAYRMWYSEETYSDPH